MKYIAFTIALFACAAAPTAQHETTPAGLAPHETYAILEHPVGSRESIDSVVEQRIRARMTDQGYRQVEADIADVLVSYKLLVDAHEAVAPLHGPASAPASNALIDDAVFVDANLDQDKALLVLIQERETFRTIWMGWMISRDIGTAELAESTENALEQILNGVPPARP